MNIKALLNILISASTCFYIYISVYLEGGFRKCLTGIQFSAITFSMIEGVFAHLSSSNSQKKGHNNFSTENRYTWKINRIIITFCQIFAFFLTVHCLLVIFGAPLIVQIEETATLSLLLTSLVCVRSFLTEGPSLLEKIFSSTKHWSQSALEVRAALILGGAWAGAIFIPLDWDRPWQVYPLTCCLGALAGEVISNVYL